VASKLNQKTVLVPHPLSRATTLCRRNQKMRQFFATAIEHSLKKLAEALKNQPAPGHQEEWSTATLEQPQPASVITAPSAP
jgi:hypothetical protein